jgi:hypothetical protein
MIFILIDDQNYGLKDIENSILASGTDNNEIKIIWYDSFEAYKKAGRRYATAAFLDYHLDIDGIYSSKIVDQINAKYLIGFSSRQPGSEKIKISAVESGKFLANSVFAVTKQDGTVNNDKLIKVLKAIISAEGI